MSAIARPMLPSLFTGVDAAPALPVDCDTEVWTLLPRDDVMLERGEEERGEFLRCILGETATVRRLFVELSRDIVGCGKLDSTCS